MGKLINDLKARKAVQVATLRKQLQCAKGIL